MILRRSKGVLTHTYYSILSNYVTGVPVNQWNFKIFELSLATAGQEVRRWFAVVLEDPDDPAAF
jgi:hypothetical protein